MAETTETNFDEFKGKDCVFVADWLKTKGLHKLCSVFEGVCLSWGFGIGFKNYFLRGNAKNIFKSFLTLWFK